MLTVFSSGTISIVKNEWAKANQTEFYRMVARLMPIEVEAKVSSQFTFLGNHLSPQLYKLILSPHSFEDIFSLVPPLFKATDKTFFIDHSSFYFFCGSSFWVGKFLEELMLFPLTNSSPIRTRRGIVMIVP